MARVELKGIHRVRYKRADGSVAEVHYAWRGKGAPAFWRSDSGVRKGSPEYIAALAKVAPDQSAAHGKFREVILAYLASPDFTSLAPRTQKDIRTSIYHANGIDAKFGDAPLAAINDSRIRKVALDWRDGIGGKVGDDRIRHFQRIIGFGLDRAMLKEHHLRGIRSVYKSNRAEVIWTDDEIAAFVEGAPRHVARILIAATETGLRPADLHALSPNAVLPTPNGHRIVIKTAKRSRLASIPVTPEMAALIAESAPDGPLLRSKSGKPWAHENSLGEAVSEWRDRLGIRSELRLYDARGTAATRLLNAGADLKEIATHMGWSIKHASEVIERYVALHPGMTDALAEKLKAAKR